MAFSPEVLKTCATSNEIAEQDLADLSAEIKSHLSRNSSFALEGIGTFSKKEGVISFKPDGELISSVNYRYLGLPIMDITGTVVSTEEPKDEIEADIDFDELPDLPEATPVAAKTPNTPISEPEIDSEGDEVISDDGEKVETSKPIEAIVEKSPDSKPTRKTQSLKSSQKNAPFSPAKNNNQNIVVIAILLVIAIIVSILTLLNQEATPPNENLIADKEKLEEIVLQMDDLPEVNWGLNGELDESLPEYYTIVLFSLRNKTNAYQLKDNLAERGFRSFIQEITIDGQQAFRVAVGQFPDTGMAQDSAAQLPEDLRSSYFLRKIQKN